MIRARFDPTGTPTAYATSPTDGATILGGSVAMLASVLMLVTFAAPSLQAAVPADLPLEQARTIAADVEAWRSAHGRVPKSLATIYGPHVPVDVWGMPWRLHRSGGSYEIVSFGADRSPGGTGARADVRLSELGARLPWSNDDAWMGA